ncbi:MAG: glycosyltransferase family 4 protein [Phycisphaerales bacterium]|nr:MAG: glycosyltransferase family 4 protein [Phycisphaerales bacterium]
MKICHVITRLIIGGAQENTVLTCRGLVEKGHDVTLIAGPETGPEGSLWDEAEKAGCRLVKLDAMRRAVKPLYDLAARHQLRRLFTDLKPEVVHTHSSKAGILGRSAAASANVPVVVHTIHGMSFNRTQPAFIQWLYRSLERWAARQTTAFVTVADAMIDQSVSAGLAPRDRFVTVRSGIETDDFVPDASERTSLRAEWGAEEGDVVVGTIARLFINKGYEEIIEAMPRAVQHCDKLKFVWIGDGANREQYLNRLEAMGLRNRVHLVGLIHPREVGRHINGFDIVLHASRWEGLPRALVQGLLMGVPAVAFDNDGSPEVVRDGQTGILVPFGDTAKLSQAIVSLATDPDLRRKLGEHGQARCREMFDWHTMVDQLDKLYLQLSAKRKHSTF